jgi:recombination protein U
MNYPDGRKHNNKIVYSGKRGMSLENDINDTNKYYLDKDIAIIYKKPTPTKVTKLVGNRIKDGFYEIPSTTDYNGIYKSKYIDFEAKETAGTSFPLENIHSHQIKHLNTIYDMGGIGFIIVYFSKYNSIYLLTIEKFNEFTTNNKRKSIPLEYFKKNGYLINYKYNPRIDYLKIIDDIYFKEEV